MSVHGPRNLILTSKAVERKLHKKDICLMPKDTGQIEVRFADFLCFLQCSKGGDKELRCALHACFIRDAS